MTKHTKSARLLNRATRWRSNLRFIIVEPPGGEYRYYLCTTTWNAWRHRKKFDLGPYMFIRSNDLPAIVAAREKGVEMLVNETRATRTPDPPEEGFERLYDNWFAHIQTDIRHENRDDMKLCNINFGEVYYSTRGKTKIRAHKKINIVLTLFAFFCELHIRRRRVKKGTRTPYGKFTVQKNTTSSPVLSKIYYFKDYRNKSERLRSEKTYQFDSPVVLKDLDHYLNFQAALTHGITYREIVIGLKAFAKSWTDLKRERSSKQWKKEFGESILALFK